MFIMPFGNHETKAIGPIVGPGNEPQSSSIPVHSAEDEARFRGQGPQQGSEDFASDHAAGTVITDADSVSAFPTSTLDDVAGRIATGEPVQPGMSDPLAGINSGAASE
jgi:hypothetical protein